MNEPDLKTVAAWIEKADHDLGTAKITYEHIPAYSDTIAFHCQQAVEKYIKAALIFYSTEFPRTHNLPYLLDILSAHIQIPSELYDHAIILNGYGVAIRYPDEIINLSDDELKNAIAISVKFREFVHSIIDSSKC
jgi:HEPN domain-containing protein